MRHHPAISPADLKPRVRASGRRPRRFNVGSGLGWFAELDQVKELQREVKARSESATAAASLQLAAQPHSQSLVCATSCLEVMIASALL